MKRKVYIVPLLFSLFSMASFAGRAQTNMGTVLFDKDWRFYRGGAQGAEWVSFDDSKWRMVDLPHDWSIEDLPGTHSPFFIQAVTQVNGGFTTGGVGWYRKKFLIPAGQKGNRFYIQFDGVYMNADIWLNGKHLGNHPYGYTTFGYDITDNIKYDENNVLVVEVKNEGMNSRWYSGSGIYRHVWLKTMQPVHMAQWGTFITTHMVTDASATVNIKTRVANESEKPADVTIVTTITDAQGREVAKANADQKIESHAAYEYSQNAIVKSPQRWSVDKPVRYMAITEVYAGQQLVDRTETRFGIRTISFDAVNGFRLNGKPVELKGGCVHHDNGPLGAKAYDRAEERRVAILKECGYNAIRSAHNPPSEAFLNACDSLGMLVIDETFDMWRVGKNPYDYHLYFDQWWQRDVESMVYRDRNHPSVILWSIGNEIPERGTPEGVKTAQLLVNYIKQLDTTRAITSAVNGLNPDKDPYFATLDVAGYNYAVGGDHNKSSIHELDHQRVPQRIIVGTESYPLEAFGAWMEVLDRPYVIGDFVWTAFDYIGEASIGWRGYYQFQNFYPWNLAYCGDIDICGWKRPQSYYRDALWKPNQLSLFVKPPKPSFEVNPARESWSKWHWYDAVADWNWKGYENQPLDVTVYSSYETVELFLNGQSLGKKATNRATQFMADWTVPYMTGTLRAVGYKDKKIVNTSELYTAGEPTQIQLTADRMEINAGAQDLSYITVVLADEKGHRHPKAENDVQFAIDGPATIVGVGNANPVSLESYQQPQRKAWQGRCLVIIKSTDERGAIKVTATAAGLKPATVVIRSK